MAEFTQVDVLNRRFQVPGVAEVVAGLGGLAKVRITAGAGSAEIYLHGAQVTSWQPAGAREALFLSAQSHWRDGKAIRGGIPICFPWFRAKADDAKAPAHGFVRTKEWALDSVEAQGDGAVVVSLSTESDEATRRWWPHDFGLVHRITVGATLELELTVTNTGSSALRFEEALHTYFGVGDVESVRVRGLDGAHYLDNTEGNREKVQAGDVAFGRATDNAYLETAAAVELIDPTLRRAIQTAKENSATTVVWNPWEQGAAALSDLGDDEWRQMACVEACNILGAAVTVEAGRQHTMRATLSVTKLD